MSRRRRCLTTPEGVYAFAGGRQAYVELIDPLEHTSGGPEEGTAASARRCTAGWRRCSSSRGTRSRPGQRLAVVEAMKMEHALTAPFAGVVRDLVSAVGEQVEMGERILRVEAGSEEEGEAGAPASAVF